MQVVVCTKKCDPFGRVDDSKGGYPDDLTIRQVATARTQYKDTTPSSTSQAVGSPANDAGPAAVGNTPVPTTTQAASAVSPPLPQVRVMNDNTNSLVFFVEAVKHPDIIIQYAVGPRDSKYTDHVFETAKQYKYNFNFPGKWTIFVRTMNIKNQETSKVVETPCTVPEPKDSSVPSFGAGHAGGGSEQLDDEEISRRIAMFTLGCKKIQP